MLKRDYYEVLSVDRQADKTGLKKAYRRLAMKYHPDRNTDDPQAEERFKEAKEAYDVLSNSQKRAAYDRFGHAGVDSAQGAGGAGAEGFRDIFDQVFGDIFSEGMQRGGGSDVRGKDLAIELLVSLEEAVSGTTSRIKIPTRVRCNSCNGSGAKPGTSPSQCSSCHGAGQVRLQQGFFSIQQTCARCRGTGRVIITPCQQCSGKGNVQKTKTLSVKVPPGVGAGDRIRLGGEGGSGEHGGPPGDLYVEIAVSKHPIFMRDGANLHCDVPISFTAATLGGGLEIPTLKGKYHLKIPAGTQTGHQFIIRGRGVTTIRQKITGDLICKVVIETPINLSKRQKELLYDFEDSMRDSKKTHDPKNSSWLNRMQSFFEGLKP